MVRFVDYKQSHREVWGGGSEVCAERWWFGTGSPDEQFWSLKKVEGLERPTTNWKVVMRIECSHQVDTDFTTFCGVVLVINLFGIVVIDHVRNNVPWYI